MVKQDLSYVQFNLLIFPLWLIQYLPRFEPEVNQTVSSRSLICSLLTISQIIKNTVEQINPRPLDPIEINTSRIIFLDFYTYNLIYN